MKIPKMLTRFWLEHGWNIICLFLLAAFVYGACYAFAWMPGSGHHIHGTTWVGAFIIFACFVVGVIIVIIFALLCHVLISAREFIADKLRIWAYNGKGRYYK